MKKLEGLFMLSENQVAMIDDLIHKNIDRYNTEINGTKLTEREADKSFICIDTVPIIEYIDGIMYEKFCATQYTVSECFVLLFDAIGRKFKIQETINNVKGGFNNLKEKVTKATGGKDAKIPEGIYIQGMD